MAVQESAAQLSMTLKVQEYPTLKVGLRAGRPRQAGAGGVRGWAAARGAGRVWGPGSPRLWGLRVGVEECGSVRSGGPGSRGRRSLGPAGLRSVRGPASGDGGACG